MALHYLEMVTATAFLLEAVQIYTIAAAIQARGGFFSRQVNAVFIWGALPLS